MPIDETRQTRHFTRNVKGLNDNPVIYNSAVEGLEGLDGTVIDHIKSKLYIDSIGNLTKTIATTQGTHLVTGTSNPLSDRLSLIRVYQVRGQIDNGNIEYINVLFTGSGIYKRSITVDSNVHTIGAWEIMTAGTEDSLFVSFERKQLLFRVGDLDTATSINVPNWRQYEKIEFNIYLENNSTCHNTTIFKNTIISNSYFHCYLNVSLGQGILFEITAISGDNITMHILGYNDSTSNDSIKVFGINGGGRIGPRGPAVITTNTDLLGTGTESDPLHIASGRAVPTGGTTGQVLSKADNRDRNTEWTSIIENKVLFTRKSVTTTTSADANTGDTTISITDTTGLDIGNLYIGGHEVVVTQINIPDNNITIDTALTEQITSGAAVIQGALTGTSDTLQLPEGLTNVEFRIVGLLPSPDNNSFNKSVGRFIKTTSGGSSWYDTLANFGTWWAGTNTNETTSYRVGIVHGLDDNVWSVEYNPTTSQLRLAFARTGTENFIPIIRSILIIGQ